MKQLITLCVIVLSSSAFSQVIFSEDFNSSVGMPAGFTMINNDGLTPATNVAYVNDAWINRIDFITPSDSCAFSTSWYTPAGTSDDWMITPSIAISAGVSASLYWEGLAPDAAYPDGYEVWVSNGAPTIAGMTGGTMVYTTTAEAQVWTPHTVDISTFAGSSVRVAFRNNATDQFILMVDSIVVTEIVAGSADVSMAGDLGQGTEYTQVPLAQISALGTSGVIDNVGTADVTNATMTVNVYDGNGTSVYSASSTPTNILMGANSTATVAGFTPTLADMYTVEYVASITEADVNINNDTTIFSILVTDSTYARDDGIVTGTLGIGPGTVGTLGQQFTMNAADDLTTVSFQINNTSGSMTGQPVVMSIFDMAVGVPNTILAQTTSLTIVDAVDSLYTMPIATGALNLAAGDYVVAIEEGDSNTLIATTTTIFTPVTTWVTFTGQPWANNEAFAFNVSYIIRPNFGPAPLCPESTASVTAAACAVYTAPSGATYSTTGMYMDTIPNACGGDSVITINLTIGANSTATVNVTECVSYTAPSGAVYTTTGMYMDTIANSCAGDSIITINLTVPVLDLSVSNVGATITAGASGSTYQWIDCATLSPVAGETGQSFTATADGSYAVIVTTSGCSDTSACTAVTVGLNELLANDLLEVYPNPSNGEFTVGVQGLVANEVIIEVLDFSGRVVGTRKFNNVNGQLTASMNVNVDAGSYLVRVTANGESATKTVVISK